MSVFVNKTIGKLWKLFTILAVAICSFLFTLRTFHAVNGVVLTPTIGMYFNSHLQTEYILHHIVSFAIRILEQPFTKSFDTTYEGIVGILTNRLIYLSILMMFVLYFGLYLGYKNTEQIKKLAQVKKKAIIVFVGIFVLTYGLIASALYVGDTSVGSTFVNGLNGRYFLPFIPLLLIIPMSIKHKVESSYYQPAVILISCAGLLATVMSLR